MILKLKRTWKTDKSTIGLIYAFKDNDLENSIFRCFILEDTERATKIKGQTAIPAGTYTIVETFSPKFNRRVYMLDDVPNFDRIYIHSGNVSNDTEGCLLPGLVRGENRVDDSRPATDAIYRLIRDAKAAMEEVKIIIE